MWVRVSAAVCAARARAAHRATFTQHTSPGRARAGRGHGLLHNPLARVAGRPPPRPSLVVSWTGGPRQGWTPPA